MPCDDVDPQELSSLERRLLLCLPNADDERDSVLESQTFEHLEEAARMARKDVEAAAGRLHELELVDIGYKLDPDDNVYVSNSVRLTERGRHMVARLAAIQP